MDNNITLDAAFSGTQIFETYGDIVYDKYISKNNRYYSSLIEGNYNIGRGVNLLPKYFLWDNELSYSKTTAWKYAGFQFSKEAFEGEKNVLVVADVDYINDQQKYICTFKYGYDVEQETPYIKYQLNGEEKTILFNVTSIDTEIPCVTNDTQNKFRIGFVISSGEVLICPYFIDQTYKHYRLKFIITP